MHLTHAVSRTVAVCLAGLALAACDRGASDRQGGDTPLFGGLTEQRFDDSCKAFRAQQKVDETLRTEAPPEIDWAPDIYAAIERATREDKPIFLSTHVNLNGDPDRDV